MRSIARCAAALLFGAAVTSVSVAQIVEVETNNSKSTATPAFFFSGLTAGMFLVGTSVDPDLDYWLISTATAPPAIYRHELVLTTPGPAGHIGTVRGLNQIGGSVGTCPADGTSGLPGPVDFAVQTSSTMTIPPRMNAWYGFGHGEQIYYRVTGTASTTANYNATLTTTLISPIVIGTTFNAGSITMRTTSQTIANTDIILLDKNFDTVMSAEGAATNDDEHCNPGTTLQSRLMRTLTPGVYYLGVGSSNSCNNLVSPTDDDNLTGPLLDFPDAFITSPIAGGQDRDFEITDGVNTYTSSGVVSGLPYEVVWARFTVVGGPPVAFCSPGAGGIIGCPCSNPPSGAGRGCNNSAATGGASIVSSGTASLSADTLVLTTSNQTPGGTTIVLQGILDNGTGAMFGQGVRCVTGSLKRLYIKSPGGTGGVTAPSGTDPSISTQSANLGDPIIHGEHRYYMAYYRDPTVLGGCPTASTYNATNALDAVWNP
jgi:hypothetical protein